MSPQEVLAFWKLAEKLVLWLPWWIFLFFVIVLLILNATVVCGETVCLYGGEGGLNLILRRCLSKGGNCLQAVINSLESDFLAFFTFQSDAGGVWCINAHQTSLSSDYGAKTGSRSSTSASGSEQSGETYTRSPGQRPERKVSAWERMW